MRASLRSPDADQDDVLVNRFVVPIGGYCQFEKGLSGFTAFGRH